MILPGDVTFCHSAVVAQHERRTCDQRPAESLEDGRKKAQSTVKVKAH
jgi:hypothetical protein